MLRRSAFLLALAVLVVGLGVVIDLQDSRQVRAGPPPAVTVRDADAVRDSDIDIGLVATAVDGVGILEPQPTAGTSPRWLAASPDGSALAFSPVPTGQVGPLTIARADGSQLEIALPGTRGAAFEPAGAWLAAVDLSGAVWRVDAASGAASRLADGPFGPDVTVFADGRILAVRVSSVEAPIWASAEWIDPDSGSAAAVGAPAATQTELAYRATALLDGGVAIVRHRTGGGVDIVRVGDDGEELPLATSSVPGVTVSPGGDRLAWIEGGTAWLGSTADGPPPFATGSATSVSFAPDGSLLMAVATDGARLVDLAGSERADLVVGACWLGGGRGCRP